VTVEGKAGGDDEAVELRKIDFVEVGDLQTLSLQRDGRVRLFGV
jgi:hypothetical protein